MTITFIFDLIDVPKITCSNWFIKMLFVFKKGFNISNCSIFNCFIFLFQFKSISFTFNYFFFRLFLCFWFASFISFPKHGLLTIMFRPVCLKKIYNFIFKITYKFSYRLIYFLAVVPVVSVFTDLLLLISFCSNLSISSIDTIIVFKKSCSISFLILSSLSFNSSSFNPIT